MAQTQVPLNGAFGVVVRRRRLALGLTQERLSFVSKLHRNHVSLIERGLTSPSLAVVETLARVFHEQPHVLVREAEEELEARGNAQT